MFINSQELSQPALAGPRPNKPDPPPRGKVIAKLLLSFGTILITTASAMAQTAGSTPSPYDFRDEIYVGGNYTRASTGLERDGANFGGWQAGSTHYFTPVWGLAFDALGIYGNAPQSAAFNAFSEPQVRKHYFMAGPQIRWRRGNRWASSLRLVAGVSNTSTGSLGDALTPTDIGLYPNATKLAFRPGTTLDYNISPRVALRLSNGALIERQDVRLKGQFSTSLGLLFRFDNRAAAASSGQTTPGSRP